MIQLGAVLPEIAQHEFWLGPGDYDTFINRTLIITPSVCNVTQGEAITEVVFMGHLCLSGLCAWKDET